MDKKVSGVRFDSRTGKIYYETEDGLKEADEGYDTLTKFGRDPTTTKIAGAIAGAVDPLSGGDDYYKDNAPMANTAGRVAGAAGMASALKSLIAGGGKLAKNSPEAIREAQKAFSKNKPKFTPKEASQGWRLMDEGGEEAIKYQAGRQGQTIIDFKPINLKNIANNTSYETARKLERLGATGGKELTENQIIKLNELVKKIPFDKLDADPRLINAIKQIVGE